MRAKKTVSMKMVVLLLAVVLVVGCAAGGTFAWLMASSGEVTNTFSVGNIKIDLKESDNLEAFKILPGTEQKKDPVVTVKGGSEDCWVFVQVKEINNVAKEENGAVTHKYVTWEIDSDVWTKLSEENGIITYYTKNGSYVTQDADAPFNVLKNQKVSYGDSLTKEMIDNLYTSEGQIDADKQPKLVFKAFAVQKEAGETAVIAWEQVPVGEYLGAAVNP